MKISRYIKIVYYWIQNKMARCAFEYLTEYHGNIHSERTLEAMCNMNKYYQKLREVLNEKP